MEYPAERRNRRRCNRNRPVAELKAVAAVATVPRAVGGISGILTPPSFFEPLPDEILDAFYGKG